jgi:ribonuclease BN (tRNA processing enzyme)
VYISHLHADHHLGLINIIQERNRAFAALGEKVTAHPILVQQFLKYVLFW